MREEIRVRKRQEQEGFKQASFQYRPDWPYISIGFGDEKDYFVENLSLLISSGMGISQALSAMREAVKSRKMRKITAHIEMMVNSGMPLWKSFQETRLVPERVVSLIRTGEESGKLADHLNLVTVQQHKDKVFNSRVRSALLYPGIVLVLAIFVALGGVWFVLPKLVAVFADAKGTLPLSTRFLLATGRFFEMYGSTVVPSVSVLVLVLVFFLFIFKRTKFIGDAILFSIPGVKDLLKGLELARFGYVFGVLLQAGFQVDTALESAEKGTTYASYKKFYRYLHSCIVRGQSFKEAFAGNKKTAKFIPIPIQQLIKSAEESGRLSETFIRTGVIYEEKTDAMSRDLATVLEPIVLIVVGLIVGFIAIAVIGPVYGLSEQIY